MANNSRLTPTTDERCRFGCHQLRNPAIVRVAMDEGCICYPDDTEQKLCVHHFVRSTPYGSMVVVEWYDEDWMKHFTTRLSVNRG